MKRRYTAFIIGLVITAFILASCAEQPTPESSPTAPAIFTPDPTPFPEQIGGPMAKPAYHGEDRTQYMIDLVFDEDSHTAAATQRVGYVNTSQDTMKTLYMHIYPKHFSKEEYVSMHFIRQDQTVYPDNVFNPGDITLTGVKAAGRAVDYSIEGVDSTILRIPLKTPLAPGQMIELELMYTLQVPHRMGRFAWGGYGDQFRQLVSGHGRVRR